MRRTYKSMYEVKNKEKYSGDVHKVVCRSSWERMLCYILDNNSEVKRWASEEVVIPYLSPRDNAIHRYFIDFAVEFKDGRFVLIEVKPYGQTIPPSMPKKRSAKAQSRYAEEYLTYCVNQAKWFAARKIAKENGAIFTVFTENELRSLGAPL